MNKPFNIGFLVYPDVIQLDIMGAYQVLAFPPNTKIHLFWKTLTPVTSNEGLLITPTTTLADCPILDIICVPGGGMGQVEVMKNAETLHFLQQKSTTTQYVTSVCTGSLIVAAANILQGYKATCHWVFREQLEMLGVEVSGSLDLKSSPCLKLDSRVCSERVVIDRDRVTAAGVTSGIDLGLTLVSLVWGEKMAKMTQLMMEYYPQPPFHAGTQDSAGEEIVEPLLQFGQPLIEGFLTQAQAIASRLG